MSQEAPHARAQLILSIRALGVRFGAFEALSGIDLDIGAGEIVALAGENGAGKTTLVRCIAGDLVPSCGEIVLDGRPVSGDAGAVSRQGAAVVWQDLALCDNLDVASNLLLGAEGRFRLVSDVRFHARARHVLQRLNIALPPTTTSVRTLSGGQRQLLAVARAMRDDPRLLFLDEPTAALGVLASTEVEELVLRLRARGSTVVLVTHDLQQMFRIADRIVVLRAGRLVADLDVARSHPDDVVALMSGQEIDSSARAQLTRLQRLAARLTSSDRTSSLPLILSTLGAALRADRCAIHARRGDVLECVTSFGLGSSLRNAWAQLPLGRAGGPVGLAASRERPVIEDDVSTGVAWSSHAELAKQAGVASSWSVPIHGPAGVLGVITVLRPSIGRPDRDELDLVALYAGYAAGAMERDRLFGEVTARNRLLETIRELLETLAGPVPVGAAVPSALRSLCEGLNAEQLALFVSPKDDGVLVARAAVAGTQTVERAPVALLATAERALDGPLGVHRERHEGSEHLAVSFLAPGGVGVLVASWHGAVPVEAIDLLADAAHSLHLSLEREEVGLAQQEAAALRRSRELQRGFLSRLSHELRTPLTAIRGYASTLLQTDVTWDPDSTQRFLSRVVAESARLGRLVDDLLDFNAIESGVMRLHRDWCNLPLVIEAARSCLAPEYAERTSVSYAPALPVVWADHDRLEQVLVNLLENAFRHNPAGTAVRVSAQPDGHAAVRVQVSDDGVGLPPEIAAAPFDPERHSSVPSAGTGLGLSIARAIVDAHGGSIALQSAQRGTVFTVVLPIESAAPPAADELA